MASVVLAAAVLGISSAINASYASGRVMDETSTATAVARQLMETILAAPFTDPGSGQPALEHYVGYRDNSATFQDGLGNTIDIGAGDFVRTANIVFCQSPTGSAVDPAEATMARITVTVMPSSGTEIVLRALRTR